MKDRPIFLPHLSSNRILFLTHFSEMDTSGILRREDPVKVLTYFGLHGFSSQIAHVDVPGVNRLWNVTYRGDSPTQTMLAFAAYTLHCAGYRPKLLEHSLTVTEQIYTKRPRPPSTQLDCSMIWVIPSDSNREPSLRIIFH